MRKRYPRYDHTAVLLAEAITSRFLNVTSVFDGVIPVLAIQMNAIEFENVVTLVFTTVLDQCALGVIREDEEGQEVTDRAYWEKRGTPATVKMADSALDIMKTFDETFELNYNKFYIGVAKNGQPFNFVVFRAQKQALRWNQS